MAETSPYRRSAARVGLTRDRAGKAAAERAGGGMPATGSPGQARASSVLGLGAGLVLPAPERAYFERRLGTDLSSVRVHTDAPVADAMGALAFAHGNDIVFSPGAPRPHAPAGQRLLAHELAHVAQSARAGRPGVAAKRLSEPGDAAEREADAAADALIAGRAVTLREAPSASIARQPAPTPPQAWGTGWFPSQGGQIPGVTTAPPPPAPAPIYPPAPYPREAVFEPPAARTTAGAPTAFNAYVALDAAGQQKAFDLSFGNGNLAAALRALDPKLAQEPPLLVPVQGLLRRIEGSETRAEAGQTDAQMAATQADFLKKKPAAAKGGDWGGAAPGKTRWEGLTDDQKKDWTKRGNKAIGLMVAHAATAAPQLALTAANFELNFEGVDAVSMGAFATGGSKPRETVQVGFEFVAICEVNPAYALSTIEHELHGHPVFDAAGGNTSGRIYDDAAALVPGSPSGTQTYEYYPSEMYSLLREIPLWVATSAADAGKTVSMPNGAQTIDSLNPDPRTLIGFHLRQMKTKWAPSLLEPMLRGFWRRVSADPGITPAALTAFSAVLTKVLGAADATKITR